MADVFFSEQITEDSIKSLFAKIKNQVKPNDKVAFKVHFGEHTNTRYVKAELIKAIVDEVLKITKNVFVSDCNTLYKGPRVKASDHIKLAEKHGFGKLGIPIIIGDGEDGSESYEIEINQKQFKKAYIGKAYEDCDVIVVITHFKGHMLESFGGAIKNLGMGMGSRRGKLAMHANVSPSVNEEKCNSCGVCKDNCEADAITINKKANINPETCTGCAKCIAVCPTKAIRTPWGTATNIELMERTAEYALAASKGKTLICFNFMNDITKQCDCAPDSEIISEDVGVCVSTDPVAADAASLKLVIDKNKGKDVFEKAHNVKGDLILEYSEKIGLGKITYKMQNL